MERSRPPVLSTRPLAYRAPRFMQSLSARPLRILAEYFDPMLRLRQEGVADTIVIFGSARALPLDRAVARCKRLEHRARGCKKDAKLKAELKAAKNALWMSHYYEEARELARRITEWGMSLGGPLHRFVVCSGGGPGIMEAANRGAHEAGGKSVGLSIELPFEQRPNRYITPELNFRFHYYFMRKLWFAQLAKALIVFPGGFGTMDELWEMLTLVQTGKSSSHKPILIYGRKYWDEVLSWDKMVDWGTINEREHGLLQFADTVEEAFDRIKTGLERHHLEAVPDWWE